MIALIAVTIGGIDQARRLRARLGSGDLLRSEKFGPAPAPWERPFAGALGDHVADWFAHYEQLVFFLATGATVRLIAPCLASKTSDPAVLAVDESGRFVIPLVGGHAAGANTLARIVAGALGATPVITTASDVIGGLSLDLLDAELDAVAEPPEMLKPMAARLLNGEPIAIVQSIGRRGDWLDQRELPANVTIAAQPPATGPAVWITDCVHDRSETLWYRPRCLVVGVGCERGISAEALEEGFAQVLDRHRYSRSSVVRIASADIKADEAGLREWVERNGWDVVFHSAENLAAVEAPTPSAVVERCVGTPGVAEPAALLASGSDRLLVAKEIVTSPLSTQRMTFALARDVRFTERTPGIVHFVGAGPGSAELLTVRGRLLLERAETIVYAGSLVPEGILRLANRGAALFDSASLTHEETMAILRAAVRTGRRVLRLHSGDLSIYSALQEQLAVLEAEGIPYEIVPGISSFQAAAAALRSELTLPEVTQTIILTRGEGRTPMPPREKLADLARHGATLCIFLSGRLGTSVQADLLAAYPPETVTAVCHRVSWPDERIIVTRLDRLAETLREPGFTRTTLILVGPAIGGRQNRSKLYDASHAHLFRRRRRETTDDLEADDPAS
jgi:precorrin-4 C11-methyltransferase